MKKILFFFTLIAWSLTFTQIVRIQSKGSIGLFLGPAIPIENFTSKDLRNDEVGLAQKVLDITLINFGYRFRKNQGKSAAWLGGAYIMDMDDLSASTKPLLSYGSLLASGLYSRNVGSSFLDANALIGSSYAELTDSDDFQHSCKLSDYQLLIFQNNENKNFYLPGVGGDLICRIKPS